jgi:hypothetical protein
MLTPRTSLARRVISALDMSPSRAAVLLGGCGSGRTTLLRQLHDRIGRTAAQYIDVERIATTPERFLQAITAASPFIFANAPSSPPIGARPAFDAALAFLAGARTAANEPATFLLDEFLELRTFESFPGLRRVLHDFIDGLAASSNRFVLTSRYVARALRLLRDRSPRFELMHMPPFTAEDTLDVLGPLTAVRTVGASAIAPPGAAGTSEACDAEHLARTVLSLADGRPAYVRAMTDELTACREHGEHEGHGEGASAGSSGSAGSNDAIGALMSLLAPEGRLARQCGFCYELRLHRARGYGALKAILEILGEEEGLTLTEISQRLQRTPGSTKDYLSWLEDVDLVTSRSKRYSFTDPLLRVWVRLHCHATAPTEDDLAREVHRYALPRLPERADPPPPQPQPEPAFAMVGSGPSSGIIEID